MFAWDPYFLSKASLLSDVLLERTSCSNRYKAFSASPPDHFGRALSCALSGEEPYILDDGEAVRWLDGLNVTIGKEGGKVPDGQFLGLRSFLEGDKGQSFLRLFFIVSPRTLDLCVATSTALMSVVLNPPSSRV